MAKQVQGCMFQVVCSIDVIKQKTQRFEMLTNDLVWEPDFKMLPVGFPLENQCHCFQLSPLHREKNY